MESEWLECTVADACSAINYGLTASSTSQVCESRFLRITDIVSGHIDWDSVPFVSASDSDRQRYKLHEGDIVIARTGATTGVSAFIKDPPSAVFASYLVRLQTKPGFDPQFLAYYLKSERFRAFVHGVVGGKSAQPNASASTMTKAPLLVPRDIGEQRAIARALGALDDRIDSLRAANATLEAIAQTLFKSWFVDFDPVHAKAEGHPPTGMDAATAALFPSEFEDSELGPIPQGWHAGAFDELVEITGGGTPKTSIADYWDGTIPWFSVVDAPDAAQVFTIETAKKITALGLANCSATLLPERTTIISARGTVGKVAMTGVPMAMNQSCYALRSKVDRGDCFVYFLTLHAVAQLQRVVHGAVFDTITRNSFQQIQVPAPDSATVTAFATTVNPLLDRILSNGRQAITLAHLRDTLLPRLISGKLRLPDAQRFAEALA